MPISNKKPNRNVYNKLKSDVSVSEKSQNNKTSLTKKESTKNIKTKVLSNENRLGNNLFLIKFDSLLNFTCKCNLNC